MMAKSTSAVSLKLVLGRYHHEPRIAQYAVLMQDGRPIAEFHDRFLIRLVSTGEISRDALCEILRQEAIRLGLLSEEVWQSGA